MKLSEFSSVDRPMIAKFDDIGVEYEGVIVKEPCWREDPNNPDRLMLVVVLQTDLGMFYELRGRTQMPDVIAAAVSKAKADELEVGGGLWVRFVELRGKAKIYAATYVPPGGKPVDTVDPDDADQPPF